ncbi:hypothetical protein [Flavobacterium seoulense]|uniref:Uncharacterized protein n=1 Tax=Flavobacterium seoulense TaxID=1492738 RepID=A0A066WIM3_9FLAO|nr:hypothetical protein [Flavobacterium seoulense]KDN53701.1 hypothetical protein FEM21_31740 [Flavobacterium seoulense]
MKTNIFSSRKAQNYLCIGLLSLFMASCGSYQNSSYYESDGIYGATANRNVERNTPSDNYYRDYFNSLQNDSQTEFITDIDQYSDFDSVDGDSYPSYAGWGNNQTGTIVNYWGMNSGFGWNNWGWNNWGMNYGLGWNNWGWNNYWGMNYGFGWNNWGWNNWGWGMNYGYGWNNWGWNNSYYYNRPYRNNYSSYTPGRRASVPNNNSREYSSSRNYAPSRSYSNARNSATSRFGTSRTPNFTNPRTYNSQNNNSQTTTNRRGTTPAQNNNYSRQQQQYNNTRQQQNSNYSRNENYSAPSRSYSSPSSYGGGSGSSGGGGGSRSYGGGSRR